MIFLGIDDTDMPGTPGTNQFARALARTLAPRYGCSLIVRHQLLVDPRIPYTSKNSSASMLLEPSGGADIATLIPRLREFVIGHMHPGSDPGFCVASSVPAEVTAFARRCQREVVTQSAASTLAATHGIHLQGCGGTCDGVIGALAAVGLIASGDDGRVVQIGCWPDDLAGPQDIPALHERDVVVRCVDSRRTIGSGRVDVGKHLRPSYRDRRIVLYARCLPGPSGSWQAVRLP